MTIGNIFPSPDLGQYLNSRVIDGIRNCTALAFPSPDLGQYLNSKVIDGIRNRNALAFPSPRII